VTRVDYFDYLFTQTWYKTTQIIATEDEHAGQPGTRCTYSCPNTQFPKRVPVSKQDNSKIQNGLGQTETISKNPIATNKIFDARFHDVGSL